MKTNPEPCELSDDILHKMNFLYMESTIHSKQRKALLFIKNFRYLNRINCKLNFDQSVYIIKSCFEIEISFAVCRDLPRVKQVTGCYKNFLSYDKILEVKSFF